MAESDTDVPTLEIDWVKTLAGALAAVTTAVLLSTLGAVGTLIGAALGSVAATVGSAIYAAGLARSRQAVLRAQEMASRKVGVAQSEVRRAARHHDQGDDTAAGVHLEAADERLDEAKLELDPDADPNPDAEGSWLQTLPWKRIGVLAAVTFLVVMLSITAFEKLAGESVSDLTGGSDSGQGTTFGGVTGGDNTNGDDGGKGDDSGGGEDGNGGKDEPTDDPSASESASEEPTPTEAPTEEPTEAATPTPTPTETPTTTPTPTTPTTAPSPSATQ